jgi:hypothetical protein
MKTYIKPSGQEVSVNENSYKIAESLGWKAKDEIKVKIEPDVRRLGRPRKEA